MKKVGYMVFALFYYLSRVFGVNPKKVFLVATHDDSDEGNIGIVAKELEGQNHGYQCIWFTRADKVTNPWNFFVRKAYHLATSGTVLLDNEFLPMSYICFPESVKVVQLWHGTGTIKKFGQDVNTGTLKKLEYNANQRITHLIVNSNEVAEEYAGAFAVPRERVYPLGLPRTDLILDKSYMEQRIEAFRKQYPKTRGKRCILYAPTFRDADVDNPEVHLDLQRLSRELAPEDLLLIRLHPHVAKHFASDGSGNSYDNLLMVSDYPGVTTLLAVADVLVTDYSSIIYEYCLLNRPMIFYAYDLDGFETSGRSFYRDYRTFVPGEIVTTQAQLMKALQKPDSSRARRFVGEMFDHPDGNAVKRLLELIF